MAKLRYFAGTDGTTIWFRGSGSFVFQSLMPRGRQDVSFSSAMPGPGAVPVTELSKIDFERLKEAGGVRHSIYGLWADVPPDLQAKIKRRFELRRS